MLDVSHEERYLFQQDVNAKEKYDGEQKTANFSSVELVGGNDFPYDANLDGMTVENHEPNYCAVGSCLHFLRIHPSGKTLVQTYAGVLQRSGLNKI